MDKIESNWAKENAKNLTRSPFFSYSLESYKKLYVLPEDLEFLKVFKKLNLQLLIITPLQKIHVIEAYVQSVHFVHNQDGERSQLRNLSIAEYHEEKRRRATLHADESREP